MSRRRIYGRQFSRLEPKRVRDYFYKYSLFVRVFTLASDGLWWMVVRCFRWLTQFPNRAWYWVWPGQLRLNETQRQLHSFVVGRTGSGKSVLLHHCIRHYLTRDKRHTVVLMDPHGDLAALVAHDLELARSDRLVYVRFGGVGKQQVHFNPFEITHRDPEALNRAQLHFASAIEQIIGETFTPRQRTLVRASMGVVLHKPGATMVDLVRLLQDEHNADLLHYAQQHLSNPVDRQFFQETFHDPLYRTTKLALVSRLTDILRDPVVQRFTCQKSTLNLGGLLNQGKVIVFRFDPSVQARDTITTLGQLLTAAIVSHVMARSAGKRHPIHLFIDECQYFVSPAIQDLLGEGRKFGLYLTLATQRVGNLSASLVDAIMANVGNFWIGGSRHTTADILCRETGVCPERVRKLPNLNFLHADPSGFVRQHRLRYLGKRYFMRPKLWRKQLLRQLKQYYRAPKPIDKPKRPFDADKWRPDFL